MYSEIAASGSSGIEVKELGDREVGDLLLDRFPHEDDSLLEQPE
jgi:hypothetical protein